MSCQINRELRRDQFHIVVSVFVFRHANLWHIWLSAMLLFLEFHSSFKAILIRASLRNYCCFARRSCFLVRFKSVNRGIGMVPAFGSADSLVCGVVWIFVGCMFGSSLIRGSFLSPLSYQRSTALVSVSCTSTKLPF